MSGFYYIKIANGLLEPKHCLAMGESVWLYMWLQDKCTSINENGEGKVLGNKPIKYELDIRPSLGISRATYKRWINNLRDAGYIKTLRTPHGLCIVITKAKKFVPKSDGSKAPITQKDDIVMAQNRTSDGSQTNTDGSKSPIQYKTTQDYTKTIQSNTNVLLGELSSAEFKKQVSKLYYEAIKSLDIPVRNHTTLKSKINEMSKDPEQEKVINYLTFMRDQFNNLTWKYKPHINESLDIHAKRASIRETFKKHIQGNNKGVTVI